MDTKLIEDQAVQMKKVFSELWSDAIVKSKQLLWNQQIEQLQLKNKHNVRNDNFYNFEWNGLNYCSIYWGGGYFG